MRRREFIVGLSTLASTGRLKAQAPVRHLLGALAASPRTEKALEMALEGHGWTVGRNLKVEYRITFGDTDRTRKYARELLALRPDVMFAETNTSMAALHAEASKIPIVFDMVSDPVGMHYFESFSKPGGNVTGFTPFEPSLGGKWVSFLKEVAPDIEHIGLTILSPEITRQRFVNRSIKSQMNPESFRSIRRLATVPILSGSSFPLRAGRGVG